MNVSFLDFTGVYRDYDMAEYGGARYFDLTALEGTDMYCSEDSAKLLSSLADRIRAMDEGSPGIHFMDSGNFHYMSLFFLQHIDEPFSLVLFDNHPDMQPPMLRGVLSCGDWAAGLLKICRCLRRLVLLGPGDTALAGLQPDERLVTIPRCDFARTAESASPFSDAMDPHFPVFLSIDKDVFEKNLVRTNWDQGILDFEQFESMVRWLARYFSIAGVDICGEYPPDEVPAELEEEEEDLNPAFNQKLYALLCEVIQ